MRRSRLFAAGVSVALLLGAGTAPAFAKPGNGKANGHAHKPAQTPPPKAEKPKAEKPKAPKSKSGVNGGGAVVPAGATTAVGEFSVQARVRKPSTGHFNYTASNGSLKVRCRGFEAEDLSVTPPTATLNLENTDCVTTRADGVRRPASVVATFTDAGEPAETNPATPGPDSVTFTVTDGVGDPVTVTGQVTGNVKVR